MKPYLPSQLQVKNYGFREELVVKKPEDYTLGGITKLPTIIHRQDGQWPIVLYEPQAEKYETWGCTVWGMENQAEMFIKEVYGEEPNYDERFTYLHSDIKEGGANPQNAYESARNDGLIDNELLPTSFVGFKDKSYLTSERTQKGQDWRLKKFQFLHDWLSDTSKETIKSALMLSPIAISVSAWVQDGDGLYIDAGLPNNHWCVAYGYLEEWKGKKGIFLKVFDSYDHSEKVLHPNHRIWVAKRIYIRKRSPDESIQISVFETLLQNGLLSFFADWWNRFSKTLKGVWNS